MKYLLIIFILIVSAMDVFSQSGGTTTTDNTKAPKYSNEFLAIGVGARAMGMGNSVIATESEVTGGYWNPSAITRIPNNLQIGAMHNEYFAGIGKYDYMGAAAKIGDSASFAISLIRFGVDDIPNTLDLIDANGEVDYSRIISFSVADYAFIFSYAMRSKVPGLRYGANVKVIRRVVGEFAGAWGFGLDASAQYDYRTWKFGAMFRDVTSTFNAWSFNTETFEDVFADTHNEIPVNSLEITMPKLLLGVAKDFKISDSFGLLIEADLDLTFDGKRNVAISGDPISIDPHMGLEVDYKDMVFFRAGVKDFQKIPNLDYEDEITFLPTLGLGLRLFDRLGIGYALADVGKQSGVGLYSNIIYLQYSIDKVQKSTTSMN